jgi:hypothetical protein
MPYPVSPSETGESDMIPSLLQKGLLRKGIENNVSASGRWLPSRVPPLLAAWIAAIVIAAPAAAQVSDQPANVTVYTLTSGRIAAIVAGVWR